MEEKIRGLTREQYTERARAEMAVYVERVVMLAARDDRKLYLNYGGMVASQFPKEEANLLIRPDGSNLQALVDFMFKWWNGKVIH